MRGDASGYQIPLFPRISLTGNYRKIPLSDHGYLYGISLRKYTGMQASQGSLKYMLIQNRLLENSGTPDFTRGTLEGIFRRERLPLQAARQPRRESPGVYLSGERCCLRQRVLLGNWYFCNSRDGRFYRYVLIENGSRITVRLSLNMRARHCLRYFRLWGSGHFIQQAPAAAV